ncbi:sugar phosphate isomerase [Mangrovactinospora gilvigrisea]|uniref:Sugar phosphate isomerase n=1 Tax=Mangrovactinospora gilvigrisea TaxID=1428644 RepID=A0A1J7BQ25_9ACTN|nr:sugar phosphate isomerase [Mangrovactinospora gilvigrisea]
MSTTQDLSRLSINQRTVKQLSVPELADGCARLGIPGVGLWREPVQELGVEAAAKAVRDAGLSVTSLCRGGFFTSEDPAERARALDDNRRAIDETAGLGAPELCLVSGGLPAGSRDVDGARERVVDALAELAPYAAEHGVRLCVEALHPMFASDRCVVTTLGQSLDIAERFPAEQVGVMVDAYHIWWDPQVWEQIRRAGEGGRISCYQISDWVTPLPEGVLLGRGQIGDGCIELRRMREAVDAVGYAGRPIEVEIFNPGLWERDGFAVLREIAERYSAHVL